MASTLKFDKQEARMVRWLAVDGIHQAKKSATQLWSDEMQRLEPVVMSLKPGEPLRLERFSLMVLDVVVNTGLHENARMLESERLSDDRPAIASARMKISRAISDVSLQRSGVSKLPLPSGGRG